MKCKKKEIPDCLIVIYLQQNYKRMLTVFPLLSYAVPSDCCSPLPPAAIEACLGHLLKRRAAGFLRSDKIAALFTKVGKVYDTAAEVCQKVQEQLQQQADLTRLVWNSCSLVHYITIFHF